MYYRAAADNGSAVGRVEARVLFSRAGMSRISNQFRMIYRIQVEIASP